MGFFEQESAPVEHKCEGAVYYRRCLGCAIRLLKTVKGEPTQEAVMLDYLIKHHGHDKDELTDALKLL